MDEQLINIRVLLKSAGITQTDIADMLKVKPPTVHNVITGKRKNPRVRKAIALAVGLPVSQIFPDAK